MKASAKTMLSNHVGSPRRCTCAGGCASCSGVGGASRCALQAGHSSIEGEISRFDDAIAEVRGELIGLQASVPATAPAEMAAFLNLHLMILDDAHLSRVPRELIRTRGCNAEWALSDAWRQIHRQTNHSWAAD